MATDQVDAFTAQDIEKMTTHLQVKYSRDDGVTFGMAFIQGLQGKSLAIRLYPNAAKGISDQIISDAKEFAKDQLGKILTDKHADVKNVGYVLFL